METGAHVFDAMSDGDALLRAILASPDDDAPRLVYADYLDEHGDPPRAAFIRAQVQLARLPSDHPDRPGLIQTERRLARDHRDGWTAWLPGWSRAAAFHRGFLETVRCPVDAYLAGADELRRRTPLTGVRLTGPGNLAVPLFRSRTLDGLRFVALSCPWAEFPIPGGTWEHLAASPYLSRLIELDLIGHGGTGAELVAALVSSTEMPGLRSLRLRFGLADEDVARLVSHPWVGRLTALDLSRNFIREYGGRALVESPHLDGLTILELRGNPVVENGGVVHVLRQRFGDRLRV